MNNEVKSSQRDDVKKLSLRNDVKKSFQRDDKVNLSLRNDVKKIILGIMK